MDDGLLELIGGMAAWEERRHMSLLHKSLPVVFRTCPGNGERLHLHHGVFKVTWVSIR